MANKTQMRLQQLTGSLVDLAYSGSQSSAGAADTLAALDLGGVLGEFAGAIARIQGKTGAGNDFTDQAEGVFNYTGADFNLDTNQAVTIDGGTGVSIDATTGNANLSTAAAASSVTLAAAGGSTNKVIVSSAGSGTDAVDINATAGGVDIDAAGAFNASAGAASELSTSVGNLTIHAASSAVLSGSVVDIDADAGALSIDGSTGINIGTQADVAIDVDSSTFDLDASAGITLTSSEAAADAIVLDASSAAGGIDMNVEGSTVVSVDSNSVDLAQQLVISAGGMDVSGLTTLRGDLQVLGTTTTVSSSNTEFADGLIGLNYSGTQTGPDRDIGLIMGRNSGNKAFFWINLPACLCLVKQPPIQTMQQLLFPLARTSVLVTYRCSVMAQAGVRSRHQVATSFSSSRATPVSLR